MWFASSHFVDMPEVIPPGFSRIRMCEPKNIIVQIPISTALVTDMKTMSMSRHFSYGQRMSLLTTSFPDGEVRIRIRSTDECPSLTEFGPGSTNQFRRGCRVRGNEDGAYRIEGIPEFLDDVLQTSFVQITYHCLPFVQKARQRIQAYTIAYAHVSIGQPHMPEEISADSSPSVYGDGRRFHRNP